ncbi:hypothetical protein HOM75_02670 [Candidatus Woesearchaeota archaeon]|jgi:hypothetical protein|nr:hypothetical protein [Candidatus Woesearchaeota archaeon]
MRRRKEKRKLFVPLFIIGIMVLSMFGVVIGGLSQDENVEKYNGISFVELGNGYKFNVGGLDHNVYSFPQELERFEGSSVERLVNDLVVGKYAKVYLDISNGESLGAVNQVYTNLGGSGLFVPSCTEEFAEEERCKELPINSCEELEENNLFFSFEIGENLESYENNCFEVNGNLNHLINVADYVVMKSLGVFNE